MYVLEQKNEDWWIADWTDGDPARTLKIENARKYRTIIGASRATTYFKNKYSHIRKIDLKVVEL